VSDEAQQIQAAREVLNAINGADAASANRDDEPADYEDPGKEKMKTPSQISGRRKSPARKAAPTSVPAKVKKLMGDGEKYRFYKVDKLGKASLVGDYTAADLANADSDIELFIQAYLLPTYGDGEYTVKAFNDKGGELRHGSYSVLSPKDSRPSALGATGGSVFEQTMVSNQTSRLNELQEQLRRTEREEREALKIANEKQAAMIASMQDGGGNNMMSMFMMMMANSEDSNRRQEAAQRKSELAMEKVRLEASIASANSPMPALPPPPPLPADPLSTILPLLGLLKDLMPKAPEMSAETMYLRDRVRDLEKRSEGPRSIGDVFNEANQMDEMFRSRYGEAPPGTAADMVKGFMDNFAENMTALKEVITAGAKPEVSRHQLPDGNAQAPAEDPDVLPDGFIDLIMELDSAADEDHADLARINVILRVIQLFANCGNRKYEMIANQVIRQITENKKKPVLYILKQILEECTNRKLIEEQSSIATYKAFDRHFDQVYETVTGEKIEKPAVDDEPDHPASAAADDTLSPADVVDAEVVGSTLESDDAERAALAARHPVLAANAPEPS